MYRRKRHFDTTPEPAPEAPLPSGMARHRASERPTFMVHKHDARRLHYDVRLEIDGALASWAVPKGPSYDPAEKRLAVQTEDHPLAYGGFEGRIPDGEYGAGDSLVWDRGTFDTVPPGEASEQRARGHLLVELDGEKLRGRWHLVRTRSAPSGKAQWLMFKAKDEAARPGYDVVAERPESVVSGKRATRGPVRASERRREHPAPLDLLLAVWPPALATLASPTDASERTHLFEVKYDGFRALAGLSGGALSLQSRNGHDLSQRFPDVARALARLDVPECVLDGEIVTYDERGVSRFARLDESGQHVYVCFDLLWLDGEDLRARPVEERRDLLASVLSSVSLRSAPCLPQGPSAPSGIALSERVDAPVAEALAEAERRGLEGLIAKRRGSPYRGARTKDWLKLKVSASDDLAIVGWTPLERVATAKHATGEPEVGALLVAVFDPQRQVFVYAGKVGTGLSSVQRREIARSLEEHRVAEAPCEGAPRLRVARWSEPRLVAQVAYTEWTRDGKLRHPSFQGLRPDKSPREAVRPSGPTKAITTRR